MFYVWEQKQLGDFTADLNAALVKSKNLTAKNAPITKKPKQTPGATVARMLTTTTPAATVSNDELIAGARLQWSVSLGLSGWDQFALSLPGTVWAEKLDALRRLMELSGLQNVQVTRSSFDTASYATFKQYPGVLVVEMTTPMNRRLKADLRYDLGQMAEQAGFSVDPNPAHNNLVVMRQGGNGTQGGLPSEPYKATGSDGANDNGFNAFLSGLGLSTPWALVAGGLILISIARR